MLNSGAKISFPTGEVKITSRLKQKATCSYYSSSSASGEFLIKSVRTSTPQLQELNFQALYANKMITEDPHILTFYDHTTSESFPDLGLFKLEYTENGNLKRFMRTHELDDDQICFIFKDILLAIIKISDIGIVHRDIYPGNVWIDKSFNFKLSGFERSLRLDDNRHINFQINSKKLNHPSLRPPDLEDSVDWGKYDIWGLGCLLHYLVYRDVPFGNDPQVSQVPEHIAELLTACLQPNPDERPLPRSLLNMMNSHKIPTLPFFFKSSGKPVTALQYSFNCSVRKALTTSPDPPDLFYLQQIMFASWMIPGSSNELWEIIGTGPLQLTLFAIKSLLVIHRLLLTGPKEVLCRNLVECLEKTLNCWMSPRRTQEDEFFCEYFSGLIRQLSRVLLEKVNFHLRTKTPSNWKSAIEPQDFRECITFIGKIVRLCEGLSIGMQILPQVNSILATQLTDECQKLMSAASPNDSNSEIKQFSERLSLLNFDLQAARFNSREGKPVKKEKFETDNVKVLIVSPSSRNQRIVSYEENKQDRFSRTNNNFFPQEKNVKDNVEYVKLIEIDSGISSNQGTMVKPSNLVSVPEKLAISGVGLEIGKDKLEPPEALKQLLSQRINPASMLSPSFPLAPQAKLDLSQEPVLNPLPQVKDSKIPVINPFNPSQQHLPGIFPPFFDAQARLIPQNDNSADVSSKVQAEYLIPELSILPKPAQQKAELLDLVPESKPSAPIVENSWSPTELLQNQLEKPTKPSKDLFSIDERWIIKPNELKYGPVLGSGSSCTVYKGEFKRTPVAIKVMRETYSGQNIVQEFQREVSAMVTLRHPNLVLFMGASVNPQMLIVSEFCAGDSLFKLLHEKKQLMLHWNQKFKMILDIARGMLYLHESSPPILHRDLKSLNLLLLEQVQRQEDLIMVKITDFGIARIIEEIQQKMTMCMGTCHWMAPEVINGEPYSLPADVYSFGIVVWEIAARETPYKGLSAVEITMKVLKGERPDMSLIGPHVPSVIKDLITWCWDSNPASRPTFRQIIEFLDKLQGSYDY